MDCPQIVTLEITIYGPFAYEIKEDRLWLYAPKCEDHEAAIFTIINESSLPGFGEERQDAMGAVPVPPEKAKMPTYKLVGIPGNMNCKVWDYPQILPAKLVSPDYRHCFLRLDLPAPYAILGINPTQDVLIYKEGLPGPGQSLATGVRLYYKQVNLDSPPSLYLVGQTDPPFYTPAFDNKYKDSPHVDMTIQFQGPMRDDILHKDAVSCFGHVAEMLGLNWQLWPLPRPSTAPWSVNAATGADCHSPVVILGGN